jgi:signal transduction histidine kinase
MDDIPVSILIVDDHPENRVALRAILSGENYQILEAGSGLETLRELLHEDVAVILLDVVMPEMNGFELAAAIKDRDRTATVPILFVTAEAADVSFIYKGYRVGAVDYLVKPLLPEMVRSKVRVFADLYRQRRRIEKQSELLLDAERKEHDLRLCEVRLAGEERFRSLAEAAVQSRDEFLSVASHELMTPLSSIRLQIEMLTRPLLKATESGPAPEQMREKLEKASKQVERLSLLVSELMDVSRIAAGKLHIDKEQTDLGHVVRDVVWRLREVAERAGCSVTVHADEPIVGHWDPMRIEQVATNLLTNALKFGDRRPVEVTASRAGSSASLVVRDCGIGMAAEEVERVFDRYERAPSARKYGGLGLGLYIVRQIIEAHGGRIRAESVPGAGSTFTVVLPLDAPAAPAAPEAAARRPAS